MTSPWRHEAVCDALFALTQQALSARQIADELNRQFQLTLTRNSIISRARRVGASLLGNNARPCKRKRKKVARAVTAERKRQADVAKAMAGAQAKQQRLPSVRLPKKGGELPPVGQRVRFADLNSEHCRYIYGNPGDGDWFYCGGRQAEGSSYCPSCHARVWQAPRVAAPKLLPAL